jgi:sugar fermentation stimulation protein A
MAAVDPRSVGPTVQAVLADVELDDGRTVAAHCPNSGRMTACCLPGQPVYLSFHDNPKRKLNYTWGDD